MLVNDNKNKIPIHCTCKRSVMEQALTSAKSVFVDGQNYDKNRPSYTDEVVKIIGDVIQRETDLVKGSYKYDCLEVGSGTGKFTKKIISILSKDVRYLATEPMPGFLDTLRANCPDIDTLQCPANEISLPDQSVKTIVAAQCFHWFATKQAMDELHRVLIPGGKLVLVWNTKMISVPWVGEMQRIINRYEDDSVPIFLNYTWLKEIEEYPNFSYDRQEKLAGVEWRVNKEDMVSHYGSISVISSLNGIDKKKVLQEFRDILHKNFGDSSEEIQYPFVTELYIFSKL